MRIHYFQHVFFEALGSIEEWALTNGHFLTSTKFYNEQDLPALSDIDWLVIMGGSMGAYDEANYSWLKGEKQFIRRAIQANKTVIGICLGAQLIADVLGSKVYPDGEKEIGWYPIHLTLEAEAQRLFEQGGQEMTVFHWHGDTFDLPDHAIRLAYSEACKNQAFLYCEKVLGLQFHLELTESSLQQMIENGKVELKKGNYMQDAAEMFNNRQLISNNKKLLFSILNKLSQ